MIHHCEECGILVKWADLVRIVDKKGKEHRLCPDCYTEKYGEKEEDNE